MKNRKGIVISLIFILLFIAQQVYSFVGLSENINERYWQGIYALLLIACAFQLSKKNINRQAVAFMLVCVLGTIITLVNGRPIGMIVLYAVYSAAGFAGYSYLKNNKVNPNYLGVFLLVLYVVYYLVYFRFRELNVELSEEGDLFGHSSSNTIAISLNFVLWIYFFIDYIQGSKNVFWIFIFAIINLVLCFIQASRMGLAVSFTMFAVAYYTLAKTSRSKWFRWIFYAAIILVITQIPKFIGFIEDYSAASNFAGFEYGEEVRARELIVFFDKMNLSHALFGYGDDSVFLNGRIYIAFLDFWNRYGLLPFLFLVFLVVRRLIYKNNYSVSLYVFLPILLYSFSETIFGGTLWDFFIYLFLFYGLKEKSR